MDGWALVLLFAFVLALVDLYWSRAKSVLAWAVILVIVYLVVKGHVVDFRAGHIFGMPLA